jgi:flavin reductase (DIM6/NTAB) family NADH-FMN oxidoreductase RutF
MRKNLGKKMMITPQPVLMIGTYDENGKANVMNAAWGGQYDYDKIVISLSEHKTTDNLRLKKEFTVSFATKDTEKISDYFGMVSGRDEDKIAKSGVHVKKSEYVDAPIIEEYPLTVECKLVSFEDGILIGEVVNTNCDEKILNEEGKVDLAKLEPIVFDSFMEKYRVVGDIVGNAFKDGLSL